MSEDFGTDPSFNTGESTPVVHEPTDDLALYRFVRSSREVPSPDFGVGSSNGSHRVLDARVGEEATQLGLHTEEPVTRFDFPPPVFETDPEILEPTDPDSVPVKQARRVAVAKPRPKIRSKRTSIKKLRSILLYGLPGLALGMAVSTWVLLDRTPPNPEPANSVVAVAKPGPSAVPVVEETTATDEPVDEVDERVHRVKKRRPPPSRLSVGEVAHGTTAAKPEYRQKLERLLRRAQGEISQGHYEQAYFDLRQALYLLKEPKRKALQRCLMRQTMERELVGRYTARIAQCVRVAASSP